MSVMPMIVKGGKTLSTMDGKASLKLDPYARVIDREFYQSVSSVILGGGRVFSWNPLDISNSPYIEPKVMRWEIFVGKDRIIFWSPQTLGVFAGLKEEPGKATAGFFMYDSILGVSCSTRDNGNFCLQFIAVAEGKEVLCAVEAPKEELFILASYFAENFANYYATSLNQNSLEVLRGIVLHYYLEKTPADPFYSVEINRVGGNISLRTSVWFKEQQNTQPVQSAPEATERKIEQSISINKEQPADKAMKLRQEIQDLTAELKAARDGGKFQIVMGIFYLIINIVLFVSLIRFDMAWYYWVIVLVLIALDIRSFSKGISLLSEAKDSEWLIAKLEKELQDLENMGGM